MKRSSAVRMEDLVLAEITRCAEQDLVCPSNLVMSLMFGVAESSVGNAVKRLKRDGVLLHAIARKARTFTVVSIGKTTKQRVPAIRPKKPRIRVPMEPGGPSCGIEDRIDAPRGGIASVIAEQHRQLALEKIKYNLPRVGRHLSEMPA